MTARTLLGAVSALLFDKGVQRGELIAWTWAEWRSVTFSGRRNKLALRFAGRENVTFGTALLGMIETVTIELSREMVADIHVVAIDSTLGDHPVLRADIEVLTLDMPEANEPEVYGVAS